MTVRGTDLRAISRVGSLSSLAMPYEVKFVGVTRRDMEALIGTPDLMRIDLRGVIGMSLGVRTHLETLAETKGIELRF